MAGCQLPESLVNQHGKMPTPSMLGESTWQDANSQQACLLRRLPRGEVRKPPPPHISVFGGVGEVQCGVLLIQCGHQKVDAPVQRFPARRESEHVPPSVSCTALMVNPPRDTARGSQLALCRRTSGESATAWRRRTFGNVPAALFAGSGRAPDRAVDKRQERIWVGVGACEAHLRVRASSRVASPV
eukprot:1179833-Prorocentrum_minimum.AAC.9